MSSTQNLIRLSSCLGWSRSESFHEAQPHSYVTEYFSPDLSHLCFRWQCDFQQCGILTSEDLDEPVQTPVELRNSKCCSVSSLTVIEHSSDQQSLWSDCAYAQADLSLCLSHYQKLQMMFGQYLNSHRIFNRQAKAYAQADLSLWPHCWKTQLVSTIIKIPCHWNFY